MKLFVTGASAIKGISKTGNPFSIFRVRAIQKAESYAGKNATATQTGWEQVEWDCTEDCFYQVQACNFTQPNAVPLEFEMTSERRGQQNITKLLALKSKVAAA